MKEPHYKKKLKATQNNLRPNSDKSKSYQVANERPYQWYESRSKTNPGPIKTSATIRSKLQGRREKKCWTSIQRTNGAFQNMVNKLAANRNAWKRAGGRWQGAKSGVKSA